jgi:hypothetical protein
MATFPREFRELTPGHVIRFTTAAGVLAVGALILAPYPHYLPPDLTRGFLANKQDFFYDSGYFLGFFAHIVSSPVALLCGTLQMSRTLRIHLPSLHRRVGIVYVGLVLWLVAPGGAVMSLAAFGGWPSTLGFAAIASLTWGFTWIAWREARAGRYASHGRWMCRSYLLMCSAILLRLVRYLLEPLELETVFAYQISVWLSWLPPLIALEWLLRRQVEQAIMR